MRLILISIFLVTSASNLLAQDDLMKELEQDQTPQTVPTIQTFKGTRIVNGQSVETKGKGALEFLFSHRFGRINSGSFDLWGLDDAFIRLGLEYGITDRLGIAIGRSSTDKTCDGYVRYKVLQQSSGAQNIPVTITAFASVNIKTSPKASDNPQINFEDRVAYVTELMIGRKITSQLSMQLTPVFVHRNSVDKSFENNNDVALGLGGRYKVSKSVALSGEYYYRLNATDNSPNFNSIGFGVDIETGGHVFQLVFTNSRGMIERSIVSETTGDFFDGDVHFGFNIARNFQLTGKR